MSISRPGPVVGVVGHGYVVAKHFGDLPVTGTPPTYVDSLIAAGARPVILPPQAAIDLLDRVDALVLTGGGDVDPARYGGVPGTAREVDPERDAAEIALVRAAAEARIPLLGICRGLQILAVASGGTLVGGREHMIPEHGHQISTRPGSRIHGLLGASARTSALHRQAVDDPGPHWHATAWAEDGTVEAIEPINVGWDVLGVQWHPELTGYRRLGEATGPALFGWLVDAASVAALHAPALLGATVTS